MQKQVAEGAGAAWPVHAIARSADLKIPVLGISPVCETRIPANGNSDGTTILQVYRKRVFRYRSIQKSR
jgi:hypothetical protein